MIGVGLVQEYPLKESDNGAQSKSYSITQYNKAVERFLKKKVPETWVHGVVTQLTVRGRVAYITLGEFADDNPKPKAILQLFMWANELEAWNYRFSQLPTPFKLKTELKVNVFIGAEFYVPLGKFQPRIYKIDENFTLGEIAQTRMKILKTLKAEGLLEKNRGLPLSTIPLNIGLVTAPQSAAFKDFTTTLLNSPFSFNIILSGAKVQGDQTEREVVLALDKLADKSLDAVCLVRGGGAKTDLIYFDSESICRAIANFPVPVITGIGHEIDTSLADLVSWANKITPTDCAKFLENRVGEAYQQLVQKKSDILSRWRMALQESEGAISDKAYSIQHSWKVRKTEAWQQLQHIRGAISTRVLSQLAREREQQERMHTGLARGPVKLLSLQRLSFGLRTQRLEHIWKHSYLSGMQRLGISAKLIASLWRKSLSNVHSSIKLKETFLKNADPKKLIQRGFGLLRNQDGKILKHISELSEGDIISTELAGGSLSSRVLSKRENV